MPKSTSRRSTRATSAPAANIRTASSRYGPRMRLTRKPATSLTTTGVLPRRRARAHVVVTTASSVREPRTTSTSGIFRTGLKKCMPHTRSGCGTSAAIASTDSDDVLVARIASSVICAASVPSTFRLTSIRSATASTTRSTRWNPTSCSVTSSRSIAASTSWSARRRCLRFLASSLRCVSCAASSAAGARSASRAVMPFSAHRLAMEPPITPAPTTPTRRISRAPSPRPSFLASSPAKNNAIRCLHTEPVASRATAFASTSAQS